MISINECRQILESTGKKYGDSEVKLLRDLLYLLAEIEHKNFKENYDHGKAGNYLHTCLN